MAIERRAIAELVAMGAIAGFVAFGLSFATGERGSPPSTPRGVDPSRLAANGVSFHFGQGASRVTIKSDDGTFTRDLDLSLVVDGVARQLSIAREEIRSTGPDGWTAHVPIQVGDSQATAEITAKIDRASTALILELRMKAGAASGDHSLALRVDLGTNGQVAFVSGVGEIADRAAINGGALLVDGDPHPLGVVSSRGTLSIGTTVDEATAPNDTMRVSVASPAADLNGHEPIATDLRIAVGQTTMSIWKALYTLQGVPTAHVSGQVSGTTDRAKVYGRDAEGIPQLRATVGADNKFELDVPPSLIEWYAAIDAARASALASFTPGSGKTLTLDVSPGGELHVTIVDPDTGRPITARLLVRGVDGSVDPSFGPDYRASGAGPIIDAHMGDVRTPLPSGKYRVAATKGIEWTVDAKNIEISAGRSIDLTLQPRHVVPTPNMVSCDLHVHSRPSFDSPVSVEDRVLSLVSAGIDFAVPTEHNVVGDYSSAIETLDLTRDFLSVTGVEVTTFGRGFGHFGVFPYPLGQKPPPARGVSPSIVFDKARLGDIKHERVLQVNHPRLPKGIGYFNIVGLVSKGSKPTIRGRMDFDTLEVYNGYDIETLPRVEDVLHDYWALLNAGYHHGATGSSDAHRIQFHWAGYPRTMALVDGAPDKGIDKVDTGAIVSAIKHGHATVTSGPIIELELGGSRPGDDLGTQDDPIKGHLRVRAAPWVDVSKVEIVVGGKIVQSINVPTRPTAIGPEPGSVEEAGARTIRVDQDISVSIGPENGWVQVLVRGERKMDDVLPFMPVAPFGFTNPIWIVRHHVPPPPTNPSPPMPKKAPVDPGSVNP